MCFGSREGAFGRKDMFKSTPKEQIKSMSPVMMADVIIGTIVDEKFVL
jgi:hypothetical protein